MWARPDLDGIGQRIGNAKDRGTIMKRAEAGVRRRARERYVRRGLFSRLRPWPRRGNSAVWPCLNVSQSLVDRSVRRPGEHGGVPWPVSNKTQREWTRGRALFHSVVWLWPRRAVSTGHVSRGDREETCMAVRRPPSPVLRRVSRSMLQDTNGDRRLFCCSRETELARIETGAPSLRLAEASAAR